MNAPPHATVTVAVCTFRRNDLLRSLVHVVDQLVKSELPNGTVRMVVIDDSPEGAASDVVDDLRDTVGISVERHASAAADIAVARNHALEHGSLSSDFVACLDDDCVPSPGWLRELIRIAATHHADIVVGHRQFVASPGASRWLREEPFLAENQAYADGSVPERANTANMLVRSSWWRASDIRFRQEMGTVGGEDMVFFADATTAGANIRFAANSTCSELCDGRRATFGYQLWRQVWLGNNEAIINHATGQSTRPRLAARAAKRVLSAGLRPVARALRGRSPQWRWAVGLAGRGIGLLLGVVGVRLRHRSVV